MIGVISPWGFFPDIAALFTFNIPSKQLQNQVSNCCWTTFRLFIPWTERHVQSTISSTFSPQHQLRCKWLITCTNCRITITVSAEACGSYRINLHITPLLFLKLNPISSSMVGLKNLMELIFGQKTCDIFAFTLLIGAKIICVLSINLKSCFFL